MQQVVSHAKKKKQPTTVSHKLLAKCKTMTEDNCPPDITAKLRFSLQAFSYMMALSNWFETQRAVLQD